VTRATVIQAAESHEDAAVRHEQAERFWDGWGRAEEAELERRNIEIERQAHSSSATVRSCRVDAPTTRAVRTRPSRHASLFSSVLSAPGGVHEPVALASVPRGPAHIDVAGLLPADRTYPAVPGAHLPQRRHRL